MGMEGVGPFAGDRATEREADHLLPPSAQIKNEWSYYSSPPYTPSQHGQGHSFYFRFKNTELRLNPNNIT